MRSVVTVHHNTNLFLKVHGHKPPTENRLVAHTKGYIAGRCSRDRCSGNKITTRTHRRKCSGDMSLGNIAATRLSDCPRDMSHKIKPVEIRVICRGDNIFIKFVLHELKNYHNTRRGLPLQRFPGTGCSILIFCRVHLRLLILSLSQVSSLLNNRLYFFMVYTPTGKTPNKKTSD